MHLDKSKTLTPIDGLDDTIEHINHDHSDDLLTLAMYYTKSHGKPLPSSATLQTVYHEGLGLRIVIGGDTVLKVMRFDEPIKHASDLKHAYIALLDRAAKATKRKHLQLIDDEFTLQDVQRIGDFYRLTVNLPNDMPATLAGLAYSVDTGNDQSRYYTLRRAWQTQHGRFGHIDIYTHGDSQGSAWVRRLNCGDSIKSSRRYPEKVEHISGQALLIADETALPTALRILELQNDITPTLIACLHHQDSLAYLQDIQSTHTLHDDNCTVLIYDDIADLSAKMSAVLNELVAKRHFDSVWGALEVSVVKSVRQIIYQNTPLNKENAIIKPYWRQDS